jgi:hypothetical protein
VRAVLAPREARRASGQTTAPFLARALRGLLRPARAKAPMDGRDVLAPPNAAPPQAHHQHPHNGPRSQALPQPNEPLRLARLTSFQGTCGQPGRAAQLRQQGCAGCSRRERPAVATSHRGALGAARGALRAFDGPMITHRLVYGLR